jgi:lysophospholipase-3
MEARLNKPADYVSVQPLCNKQKDWYTIWYSPAALLYGGDMCWNENIKLIYDNASDTWKNNIGVETRVKFPLVESVDCLDGDCLIKIGKTITDRLVNEGLVKDKSIRGGSYDFRQVPDQKYVSDMKGLIEETYTSNGNRKVVLISVSMGCKNILYFLNQQSQDWKDKFINLWIPIGGIWAGTAGVLGMLASGDNSFIPTSTKLLFRSHQRSWPVNLWMLPTPGAAYPKTLPLASINGKTYSAYDYEGFFNAINYPLGYKQWLKYKDRSGDLIAPGVPTYHLYSTGIDTPITGYWNSDNVDLPPNKVIYSDGDETANIKSLTIIESLWSGNNNMGKTFKYKSWKGIKHRDMVSKSEVLDFMVSIIRDADTGQGKCYRKSTYKSSCLWFYTTWNCNAGDVKVASKNCGSIISGLGLEHTCEKCVASTAAAGVVSFNDDSEELTIFVQDSPIPFVLICLSPVIIFTIATYFYLRRRSYLSKQNEVELGTKV